MEELIKVLTMIKEECGKRPCSCDGCLLYDDVECMIEYTPCNWNIENIKQALTKKEEKHE